MRTPPKEAPPQVLPLVAKDDIRTYRFITPVFGGGVEPKKFDSVTPVRVASIRGQLRFWWRAANPRGCTTVAELRSAEEVVFGSTNKASPLVVRVNAQVKPPLSLVVLEGKFAAKKGMKAIAYGAFPLRDNDPDKHGVLYDFDKSFELAFTYPQEIERDVDAALWAWAHFGSLGGRTRRGFGAIEQVSPALETIDDGWARFVTKNPAPWPHLEEKPVIAQAKSGEKDGMAVLKQLLVSLHKIRQGSNVGRRSGNGNTPGRSYWPEPDAIRKAFKQSEPKHSTPVTDHDCFPRAAFGTPIIFHFKDGRDPEDTTLQPKDHQRLASRLLLRPHRGTSGQVEAMALVLAHPPPAGGYVLQQGGQELSVSVTLKKPLSLGDNRAFTAPIERFLKELLP